MAGLAVLLLLGAAVCAAQPRGRILGGQEAEAHARPYMASVQVDGRHLCGGVLVAAQWVLSAAHCLEEADGKVQVLLGAHSLSRPEPSKRLYDVSRSVPHPDSSPDTIDHDLLLLQVSPGQRCLARGAGSPPRAHLAPTSRPGPVLPAARPPGAYCTIATPDGRDLRPTQERYPTLTCSLRPSSRLSPSVPELLTRAGGGSGPSGKLPGPAGERPTAPPAVA
ncbi:PREDICTED: complement factor D [Chinchilla lanigera]|uniref:complement factor D n=1 Tax=Chinchilla lanigera TaxID=34839 RepID=UPI00038EBA20|nr:PREDICTED: complement factor D [Chinchilla lanigera]